MEPFFVFLGIGVMVLTAVIPVVLIYLAWMVPALNRRVRTLEAQVAELTETKRLPRIVMEAPRAAAPRKTVPLPAHVTAAPPAQEPVDLSSAPPTQEPVDLSAAPPTQEPVDLSAAPPAQEPVDLSAAPPTQEPVDLSAAPPTQEPVDLSAAPPAQKPRPRNIPKAPPGRSPLAMIQENFLVVVGVLILFIGFAALIQFGASEGWFSFPIELRLAGIAAVGVAGLAFGWIQRTKRRGFGLTLQGGGIGILLMTVFSAFKFYDLLPPTLALTIALILVASAGVLAVFQNSSALVVLAYLAGFASPLLISSGSGNYVALFSYYAVLNVAVMAVAWFKPWRWLNLLGFFFTFGIGIFWGVFEYSDDKLWSTLPFVVIYYVLYLLIPVFNSRRGKGESPGAIDGILIFGNPLFSYFALSLLFQEQLPLAFAALGLAVMNAGLAGVLLRFTANHTLGRYHAAIALVFATLAVPLAFSAGTSAGVFAIEGLVMAWLGLREKNPWLQVATPLLFLLAGALYAGIGTPVEASAILNPTFMSGLLISLAGFAAAAIYHREKHIGAILFYLWGLMWWVITLTIEVDAFVPRSHQLDALIALMALTIGLLALAHYFLEAVALRWTMALAFLAIVLLGLFKLDAAPHLFAEYGFYAWLAYGVLGGLGLFSLRNTEGVAPGLAHSAWLFGWVLALSSWLVSTAETQGLAQGWVAAAAVLPSIGLVTGLLFAPKIVGFPMNTFVTWRPATTVVAQILVFLLWIFLLVQGGDAGSTWLPIINPVDLSLLGILGLFTVWLRSELVTKNASSTNLAVFFLLLVTITNITLRSVHHFTAAPWSIDLWDSAAAQMSLTIVWSLIGMANWIVGSKRGNRGVWKLGAFLIAIVLVKLLVVDRSHLGALMGIGSFIGYGVLCLIVGYLAPAPPSKTPQKSAPEPDEVP